MLGRLYLRPMTARTSSAARCLPRCHGRQSRAKLHCVTVNLNLDQLHIPGHDLTLKRAAIDSIAKAKPLRPAARRRPESYNPDDAAVILVSRRLASWLEDNDFIAQLIKVAGLDLKFSTAEGISILSAAVDEVPRYDSRINYFASAEGLSVVCGSSRVLLPNLWDSDTEQTEAVAQPYLEFELARERQSEWQSRVTVPVANTVFSNGKPHVLLASRWEVDGGEHLRLSRRVEKKRQTILTTRVDMQYHGSGTRVHDSLRCPFVPVTKPRKIVAGLGNILRQIEIDSEPVPASKELEAVIPALVDLRSRSWEGNVTDSTAADRPSVWALVFPRLGAGRFAPRSAEPLRLEGYTPSREWHYAQRNSTLIHSLMLGGGCQLRKILSGGGGWGPKQGLLSLDPQTSLTAHEDQDLENFIASFEGEDGGPDIFLRPGSYVQFFVEPISLSYSGRLADFHLPWYTTLAPTLAIGTSGAAPEHPLDGLAHAWPALFGAVSSKGIYFTHGKRFGVPPTFATKLDAAPSYYIASKTIPPAPE